MWILGLFVVFFLVLSILHYLGMFGQTVVERKIFENSFQYSEARKTEIATFEAQLAEINRSLTSSEIDDQTKSNLEAQAAGLRIKLQVARSR